MSTLRIKTSTTGIRSAALTSPAVRAAVSAVAERMAATVRAQYADGEVVVINGGRSRARSYVRMLGPSAAEAESKYRYLGRALAGRKGGS